MDRVIFNEIPLIPTGLYERLILRINYISINHIKILDTPQPPLPSTTVQLWNVFVNFYLFYFFYWDNYIFLLYFILYNILKW